MLGFHYRVSSCFCFLSVSLVIYLAASFEGLLVTLPPFVGAFGFDVCPEFE